MIGEEFDCAECGDTYLSPRAALLCEDRDLEEGRLARRVPVVKKPNAFVRAYD